MDLKSHFSGLLAAIEPSSPFVSKAKAAHERLRDELRNDGDAGRAHLDTFLSGSYARHTAIFEIKDVDIICVLDIDKDVTVAEELLAWLESILLGYYDEVSRQGRSVRVTTPRAVHLDVVPGVLQQDENGPLHIPDREVRDWVPTHPKGQLAFALQRNRDTDGYYVQVVKLIKCWRDGLTPKTKHPKSYIVETLVAEMLGERPPDSHAAGVVQVFDGIWHRYSSLVATGRVPRIADPGYPTISVSKRWTSEEFDWFIRQVGSAATIARKAREAVDESTSVVLWRRLFGDAFKPPSSK